MHPVVLVAARGEHDHRHGRGRAQPPAHLEPVELRQHQIEHDEVGPARCRPATSALSPSPTAVTSMPVALEIAHDDLANRRVVLDDEHVRARGHHCDHIVTATTSVQAACSANHGRRGVDGRTSDERRGREHRPRHERQPDALDLGLRHAAEIGERDDRERCRRRAATRRRSRSRPSATATAGPVATANNARSAKKKYE